MYIVWHEGPIHVHVATGNRKCTYLCTCTYLEAQGRQKGIEFGTARGGAAGVGGGGVEERCNAPEANAFFRQTHAKFALISEKICNVRANYKPGSLNNLFFRCNWP